MKNQQECASVEEKCLLKRRLHVSALWQALFSPDV